MVFPKHTAIPFLSSIDSAIFNPSLYFGNYLSSLFCTDNEDTPFRRDSESGSEDVELDKTTSISDNDTEIERESKNLLEIEEQSAISSIEKSTDTSTTFVASEIASTEGNLT